MNLGGVVRRQRGRERAAARGLRTCPGSFCGDWGRDQISSPYIYMLRLYWIEACPTAARDKVEPKKDTFVVCETAYRTVVF